MHSSCPSLRRPGSFPAFARVASKPPPSPRLGRRRTPNQTWIFRRPMAKLRCPLSCPLREPPPTARPTFLDEPLRCPVKASPSGAHAPQWLVRAWLVCCIRARERNRHAQPMTSKASIETCWVSQLCQLLPLRCRVTLAIRLQNPTCRSDPKSPNHQSTGAPRRLVSQCR